MKVDFSELEDAEIVRNPLAASATPSSSEPGVTHVTVLFHTEEGWCSCKGFQYTSHCKHLTHLFQEVLG